MIHDVRQVLARSEGVFADAFGAAGLFALLIAGLHLPVFA